MMLDREFPNQVLVPADNVRGKALDRVIAFHDEVGVDSGRMDLPDWRSRGQRSIFCFFERALIFDRCCGPI